MMHLTRSVPTMCAVAAAAVLALPTRSAAQRTGRATTPSGTNKNTSTKQGAAAQQPGVVKVTAQNASKIGVTPEVSQSATLPPLPAGMTLQMIQQGDSIFHGAGHCYVCHGVDAQGEPDAGSALTNGVNFIQDDWGLIDSLVAAGIPEGITRSSIRMPPRGGRSDLSPQQIQLVAAYVWAITKTRGEPWPGGHTSHASMVPSGVLLGRQMVPSAASARKKP